MILEGIQFVEMRNATKVKLTMMVTTMAMTALEIGREELNSGFDRVDTFPIEQDLYCPGDRKGWVPSVLGVLLPRSTDEAIPFCHGLSH